jgi:hypothetical protein
MTSEHVIVWDLETVPDIAGYAAANGLTGKSDEEIREECQQSAAPAEVDPPLSLVFGAFTGRYANCRSYP